MKTIPLQKARGAPGFFFCRRSASISVFTKEGVDKTAEMIYETHVAEKLLDLTYRMRERAIRSLMDINISKQGKDLVIRFKATNGFVPNAFHGLPVALVLGDGCEVPGVLNTRDVGNARGLWFPYVFHALRADDYSHIRFKGLWRWLHYSNVKKVRLETEPSRFMLNPFFKK